jgi:hypothetical protein
MSARLEGFRFVYRPSGFAHSEFDWVHPLELREEDVDVTDLDDIEFERFVYSVSPEGVEVTA